MIRKPWDILITSAFQMSDTQRKKLEDYGCRITCWQDESDASLRDCSRFSGVVCNNLFETYSLSSFPNLQFIQLTSAGSDRVPVDEMQSNGIQLFTARDIYSIPIAEWAVLRILEFYKESRQFDAQQRKHIWKKRRNLRELAGSTAVIVGIGSVGKAIAERLKAFDVHIIGIDSDVYTRDCVDLLVALKELDEAVSSADVLILALPLNSETYHVIDNSILCSMKDDVVIVNVARGGLIDQAALEQQLIRGKFAGVALDVFEDEPLSADSPLWDIDRVTITPHNSFVSNGNNKRLFDLVFSMIQEQLKD